MKRALFAIASVAIVATAVGMEAANAHIGYSVETGHRLEKGCRLGEPERGRPGYGYGPGPYFVCQAVGARSVGYGRAYFVADAKWQALIRCERYSGICIISYCVPAS